MRFAITTMLLACGLLLAAGNAGALEGTWAEHFHATGPDRDVECLLRWNGDVYAGGAFTAIGPRTMPCGVARWHDGQWEPVGHAIEAYRILDLEVHDGALHVLGQLQGGRRVWRLDGGSWTAVGPIFTASGIVLGSYQGDLYLGGHRLEEGAWVDRLQTDGTIRALTVHDGLLVAGGGFTSAGGVATGRVCAWDGDAVVNAHPGQTVTVDDLEVFAGELHASRYSGGSPLTGVQVWRGGTWVDIPELGTVTYVDEITDLAPGDGRLLVTRRSFQIIIKSGGGSRASSLTAWDGAAATILFSSADRRYLAAAEADDGAWLAGAFILDDDSFTANLGRVRGGTLEPVCAPGYGASGTVYHLEPGPFGLAVGGGFWTIGQVASRGVALCGTEEAWDSWGFQHWPQDPEWYYSAIELAWNGSILGTYANGHANEGVGEWLGSFWWFGDWIFQTPSDLIGWQGDLLGPSGGALYAYSAWADPVPVAAIAGQGRALRVVGGDLVMGGGFTSVDGTAAQNIARNDGSDWAPMGDGLPETVIALGRYAGDLVAVMQGPGGDIDVNDIMTWDGAAWHHLAQLTGGRVTSLAEYAGCLVFGGYFDMPDADGEAMRGIACWNGSAWESMGEAYPTQALAVYEDKLWVGGGFRHAGGVPACRLSYFSDELTATPDGLPPAKDLSLAAPAPNPFNPRTTLHYELPRAAHARLEVFDAAGRRVATLVDAPREAGSHVVDWTGTGDDGRALPSGTYLIRLRAGEVAATAKATLVR